jgi:hypothetical protein
MSTAVLNVSLDDKICQGASVQHRFNMVMRCMKLCFQEQVIGEIQTVQYDGPDGPVREDCAVITIGVADLSRTAVENALYMIANNLGQECIAILYADDQVGKCIGPGADRWPFDRKHFNLPAVCRLAEAA